MYFILKFSENYKMNSIIPSIINKKGENQKRAYNKKLN